MPDLMEKWQHGDVNAFETLFRQYEKLVYKTAYLITGNKEVADDVLQDKESRRGFWSSFTLGRVATAATAVVILIVAIVIWQFGGIFEVGAPPPTPAPAPAPAPAPSPVPVPAPPPGVIPPVPGPTEPKAFYSLDTEYIPSEAVYMPGETIEIEVRMTNVSTGPVVIEQFPPKINIYRPDAMDMEEMGPGKELGTVVHTFPAGTEERRLGVDETVSFSLTWGQKDQDGKQVPPGWYYRQTELHLRTVEEPVNKWISGGGQRFFLIQYPQGAMEKSIDLDMSYTASGLPLEVDNKTMPVDVTLTLKHVELTREGVGFSVLLTSPDYPLPGDEEVWWRIALDEHAEYIFDGTVKDARGAQTLFTDEGIELRWGHEHSARDPIPSDARELTFIITRLGDNWVGPWEFKIPLE
jgi:hypothetical protein